MSSPHICVCLSLINVSLLHLLMYTTSLRLISGGRVTIPARLRNELGLDDGDSILVTIENPRGER